MMAATNENILFIANSITEDPDEFSEGYQLAQALAEILREKSKERGEVPLYPEVSKPSRDPHTTWAMPPDTSSMHEVIVKSPEDWVILRLGVDPPHILVQEGWQTVYFDLHQPDSIDKIYAHCKKEYAKKKKRSHGRTRIPRN
jgi:hypothetical protein